ncbi:MAG: hypothetical protein ACI80V_000053 [Rhodothermales bacterium]|jgi:hypothetical protein
MTRFCPLLLVVSLTFPADSYAQRSWIAGDHHIHSRWSVGWDRNVAPPAPIKGGDAIYPIAMNAVMARRYGLGWMVATDHGGPNHSKVSLEHTYPELLISREAVPEVIQFHGMEFDTPGADHSSLIIPHTHDEAERLSTLESRWSRREPWPADSTWDSEARMIQALSEMRLLSPAPVVIANHPSRSAEGVGSYGLDSPAELRRWNDTAPNVAVGMAGAPGHQANAVTRDGSIHPNRARGAYSKQATFGGFDQMTARLGGFWDSMIGEGRRWWITANSDSHIHWREGGGDFWPGEYSKTYVMADRNHDDILDGIRNGRVFVTTGDLVSQLGVTASANGLSAGIGGVLTVPRRAELSVEIRFLDPNGPNAHGDDPSVRRVDLILGEIHGILEDPTIDRNPTTRVVHRFDVSDCEQSGPYQICRVDLGPVDHDLYLRVRGTNTQELEPAEDPRGEDPWSDLWFYSNPVFVSVQ